MRRPGRLLRDRKGISAVEFALIAPVMFLMIVGLTQVGRLFFADADLRSALAAGAREATIYPMPADDTILDRVESQLTGLNPDLLVNEIQHYVDANGAHYAILRVAYQVRLDFLFFEWGPVMLEARRTVYTNDPAATWATTSTSASSTGGTTSATSAGGTTSTSGGTTSTTSGGTTSTTSGGTTSTTSGGTTSTTSSTTSGGTTSTTSGGTTSTTSGGTTSTTSGGTTSTTSGGTTSTTSSTTSGGTTSTTSGGTPSSSSNGNAGGNGNGNGRPTGGTCRRC